MRYGSDVTDWLPGEMPRDITEVHQSSPLPHQFQLRATMSFIHGVHGIHLTQMPLTHTACVILLY